MPANISVGSNWGDDWTSSWSALPVLSGQEQIHHWTIGSKWARSVRLDSVLLRYFKLLWTSRHIPNNKLRGEVWSVRTTGRSAVRRSPQHVFRSWETSAAMRPTEQAGYEDWQETDAGRRTWLKLQRTNSQDQPCHIAPHRFCARLLALNKIQGFVGRIDSEGLSKPASEQYRPAIPSCCAHNVPWVEHFLSLFQVLWAKSAIWSFLLLVRNT